MQRCNLKEIRDCKVVAGEGFFKQHQIVCRMTLKAKTRRRLRTNSRIRWWRLKENNCCVKFREEMGQVLEGYKRVLNNNIYCRSNKGES